jgi:hypothetical protein
MRTVVAGPKRVKNPSAKKSGTGRFMIYAGTRFDFVAG